MIELGSQYYVAIMLQVMNCAAHVDIEKLQVEFVTKINRTEHTPEAFSGPFT